MSDREPFAPELKAVEAALAALVPTSVTPADRDRLMFAAGRAAAGSQRLWVRWTAAAAMVLAALFVGRRTAPRFSPIDETPAALRPATVPPADGRLVAASSPTSYFQLRCRLDRLDVVGVDQSVPGSHLSEPSSHRALLQELLN